MKQPSRQPPPWRWVEGPVDPTCEHIELRHGDARGVSYEQWTPVAIIGRPIRRTFSVRWLLDPSQHADIVSAARRELDFYLIEHPREFVETGHPWQYAIYHCGTAANMYSNVHWAHFPSGSRGERHVSAVR